MSETKARPSANQAAKAPRRQGWPMLPSYLGKYLTVCASGRYYCMHVSGRFLKQATDPDVRGRELLLDIGFGLLHRAWDSNPGDPTLGAQLVGLDETLGGRLSPAKRRAVLAMAGTFRGPVSWPPLRDELAARGGEALCAEVEIHLRRDPENLHWWWQAMNCAKDHGAWDWLLGLAGDVPAGVCAPFAARARADALFHQGRHGEALAACRALRADMEWPGLDQFEGECLLRMGDREGALELWRASLRQSPWQTNLLLRAHDVRAGLDAPGAHPEGRTCLLLYSWNKARSLDRTLGSLAESDLGDARIIVLDNGSADETPDVVRAWGERLGSGRFQGLSTLVNVGAPAARNWLMHLPEVRASDNVVYMDDDILLPPDWLGYMGAAQAAYPEAGVWGCRVVEDGAPHNVQHADEFLMEATDKSSVGYCCQYLDEMDFGQFTYLRPCLSVTGCLHMFRTGDLHRVGGFDLQFSPSQFDDAEHDLRLCSQGGYAVYQGHLRILHERNTGSTYETNNRSSYGIEGNFMKLNLKYSNEEVENMRTRVYALALGDLRAKLAAVLED
ncbi:glycosyltransferase family 2 protein [Desulfocurvus sp. DL9XJH121]